MHTPTPAQRRVWEAMAELYLDTAVDAMHARIVRCLAESPFSLEQLRTMLLHDVHPVLRSNIVQRGRRVGRLRSGVVERGHRRTPCARVALARSLVLARLRTCAVALAWPTRGRVARRGRSYLTQHA